MMERSGATKSTVEGNDWQEFNPDGIFMRSLSNEQIEEIRDEFNSRGKIPAVKLYKTWANCSLLEAKVAVEAIESDEPIPEPQRPDPAAADPTLSDVDQAIANGNKIEAIKRHRELTGLSLLESVQFVELRANRPKPRTLYETSPTRDPTDPNSPVILTKRSGCFSALLLFVGLATGSTLAVYWQL